MILISLYVFRLPSKSDLEKKIELAKFFSRTRNLFIRLEALAKWANSSSKVDKCEVTSVNIFKYLVENLKFSRGTEHVPSRNSECVGSAPSKPPNIRKVLGF